MVPGSFPSAQKTNVIQFILQGGRPVSPRIGPFRSIPLQNITKSLITYLLIKHPPLASALYSCTRVINDLHMVVMEYLSSTKPPHRFFPGSFTHPLLPDVQIVLRDLKKAVGILHKKGTVFGDLREENVLCSSKDVDRDFLVDFDDVRKHGRIGVLPALTSDWVLARLGGRLWTSHIICRTWSGSPDGFLRGSLIQAEIKSNVLAV